MPRSGEPARMEPQQSPRQDPEDATEVTEEQRRLQDELDHRRGVDPEGPGLQQSRHQVADET